MPIHGVEVTYLGSMGELASLQAKGYVLVSTYNTFSRTSRSILSNY